MLHNFLNLFNGGMAMVGPAVLAICHVYYNRVWSWYYVVGVRVLVCVKFSRQHARKEAGESAA